MVSWSGVLPTSLRRPGGSSRAHPAFLLPKEIPKVMASKLELARIPQWSPQHPTCNGNQLRQFLHCRIYLPVVHPKEELRLVVEGASACTTTA